MSVSVRVMICAAERRVGGMIDAGVRVHAGVDIYSPCSGLACCGLGGLFVTEQNLGGQQELHFICKKRKREAG